MARLIERAGAVGADLAIETAAEVAKGDKEAAESFHKSVQDFALPHVTPVSVVDIAEVDGAESTLGKIESSTSLEDDVRRAAMEELKHKQGNA